MLDSQEIASYQQTDCKNQLDYYTILVLQLYYT
nr:MAG TPA: hypothetical protein [Caudoviricetes sp.]